MTDEQRPRRFKRKHPAAPISDDPGVNAVGQMSRAERSAILEDPDHPEHGHVKEYTRLKGEQFARAMAGSGALDTMNASIGGTVADVLGGLNLGVNVAGLMPEEPMLSPRATSMLKPAKIELEPLSTPMQRVVEKLEENNEQLLKLTGVLSSLLEKSEEEAEGQRKRANRSLAAAWVAVGLSGLVGIAQIVTMVVLD